MQSKTNNQDPLQYRSLISSPRQETKDTTFQEDVKVWLETATVHSSPSYLSFHLKGTSTVLLSSFEVELIESLFMLRDERTVFLSFLEKNPYIATLLIEAYKNIRKHFLYATIFLQVVTDPEEYEVEQLVASIAVDMEPDEAIDILSHFDKMWWLKAQRQAQGKLCITLEF